MMTDIWFIQNIDHRISTALIFTLLLLTIGGRCRRPMFSLRVIASSVCMCIISLLIRYVVDVRISSVPWQGVGYACHLLLLSMIFMGAHAVCYETTHAELFCVGLFAMTIFKLAWNTFKVCAAACNLIGQRALWSTYSIMGSLVSYMVYALVCVVSSWLYHRIVKEVPKDASLRPIATSFSLFMLCQLVLEFCGRVFTADESALFLYYLCALMYTMINYVVLLMIPQLHYYRRDNEDMHNFIRNKMQYYRMSRDGITSLQIKCHDLKHQIAAIRSKTDQESFGRYLDRLEDSIIEYGTVVECGNETINTVLTEKNILCSTCSVKFSYIIDGTLFDFMSEMEIYSLFGNALDNALESCSKVQEPEKRVISLKAARHGDMVVLHVENSYDAVLKMVDGIPCTTKKGGGHGFGLRSIQQIAQRYEGMASVQAEENIFKLTVFLKPGQA